MPGLLTINYFSSIFAVILLIFLARTSQPVTIESYNVVSLPIQYHCFLSSYFGLYSLSGGVLKAKNTNSFRNTVKLDGVRSEYIKALQRQPLCRMVRGREERITKVSNRRK